MSFTPFIPDIDQWSRYFMKQAENNGQRKTSKTKDINSSIGGSISSGGTHSFLSVLGPAKKKDNSMNKNEVKVNMTSPAEATADQAASEIEGIKDVTSSDHVISFAGGKTKGGKRKGAKQTQSKKKKLRVKQYKDIFSK
jgi:hypothetical protein